MKREAEDCSVGAGVERGIDRAGGQQTGEVIPGHATNRAEGAADDDPSIGLDDDRGDLRGAGTAHIGVKGRIDPAVGQNAGEAIAERGGRRIGIVGLKLSEKSADNNAAVGLESDGGDVTVRGRVEFQIERAVAVKPGKINAIDAVRGPVGEDGGERSADDDLAIALGDGGEHGAVEIGVETVVGGRCLADERGGRGNHK